MNLFFVILCFRYGTPYLAPVMSVCSRSHPNLEKCIIDAVDKIRQNVNDGDYGDGRPAPKLDPVHFDKLTVSNGPAFMLSLSNVTIKGPGSFKIKKIRYNLDERKFNISTVIPEMHIFGKYDLKMNILLLKATGNGDFHLALNDTLANMKMEYFIVPTDGKNLVRFKPIDTRLKFNKARFHLTNLFNSDLAMEQFGNQALNQNPNLLLDEVKPTIEKNLGRVFTDISNSAVQGAEEFELLPP